jgi:sugar phosphate isomerase/epimerase
LRYNIHLPLDLRLGHAKAPVRTAAVETLIRLFDLAGPLVPTTWTLHLPMDGGLSDKEMVSDWRRRVMDSLGQLIDSGIPPRTVTLENLDYPIETVGDLARQTGFRMCLDAGHLIAQRVNVPAAFDRFRDRIDMVHLHGVRNGRDHLSLAVLQDRDCCWIPDMLASFTGTVSLEVFSYDSLVTSLDFFETLWEKRFDGARGDMVGITGR